MKPLKISLCYYPTTSLLIDDNEDFLTSLYLKLMANRQLCRYYVDPAEVLNLLNYNYNPSPFTNFCLRYNRETDLDHVTMDFDFRRIHHAIYNPTRFTEITTLVIDYAMPTMDGLKFCRELQEEAIKKLLLTAEAGDDLAVVAFNESLIDKFMKKSSPDLPTLLMDSIDELQRKYFLHLSTLALSVTAHSYKQEPPCLSDRKFIELFNAFLAESKAVEFYLLDEHGSFLFLDAEGKPSWLIVKTEEDMEDIYQFALAQDAPKHILNLLKDRAKVPYFHTNEDLDVPFDDCEPYLHPAKQLKGKHTYYYAYLTDPNAYKLDHDRIVSFQGYLDSL